MLEVSVSDVFNVNCLVLKLKNVCEEVGAGWIQILRKAYWDRRLRSRVYCDHRSEWFWKIKHSGFHLFCARHKQSAKCESIHIIGFKQYKLLYIIVCILGTCFCTTGPGVQEWPGRSDKGNCDNCIRQHKRPAVPTGIWEVPRDFCDSPSRCWWKE